MNVKRIFISILTVVVASLALYGFVCILSISLDKNEISSCLKLQGYAEEFEHTFYVTQSQYETCLFHGIHINAPVDIPVEN